jgi:hypothetical protein
VGAIKDNLPQGASRNKIDYLAEQMDSLGGGNNVNYASVFEAGAYDRHYQGAATYSLEEFRSYSGCPFTNQALYCYQTENDNFTQRFGLAKAAKLFLSAQSDEDMAALLANVPSYVQVIVQFPIVLNIWFSFVFPAGTPAPSAANMNVLINDAKGRNRSFFAFDYQWDDTAKELKAQGAIIGSVDIFQSDLDVSASSNEINAFTFDNGVQWFANAVPVSISVQCDGLNFDNASPNIRAQLQVSEPSLGVSVGE